MTAWWQGRMAAFDVESTGVDYETDRIVTAAVALCGGGLETRTVSLMADPGIEIDEGASLVHGITTEQARAEGEPAAQVVAAVLDALRPAVERGWPIVAFNARFDLTMLDREARRYDLEPLGDVLVVDPLVIDKHLHRYRRGSRKLDAQCEHYAVVLDEAHEAAADAVAAARVAYRIGQRGQVIRRARTTADAVELAAMQREWEAMRSDLPKLHAAQVRWAAEQAASLEDYFRSKGTLESPVERAWPVVPVPEPVA